VKIFKIMTGVVLFIMLAIGGLFASVFIGNKPIEDRSVLNGHSTTINDGYVAVFLLPIGEGKFALVDCGNDESAKAIKEELAKRGSTVDSVEAILLTHGHPDHIAGCKAFPKAKVYGFAQDAAIAAGTEPSHSPMGKLAGTQKSKVVTIASPLSDGQDLQLGDTSVHAYHVPGHTQGSGAYLARSVLYLGDSLTSKPDGSIIDPPWMFSEDRAQNTLSIARLLTRLKGESQDVLVLAFSHSGSLKGLDALSAYVAATSQQR